MFRYYLLEKGRGIVSPPHFVNNFSKKKEDFPIIVSAAEGEETLKYLCVCRDTCGKV